MLIHIHKKAFIFANLQAHELIHIQKNNLQMHNQIYIHNTYDLTWKWYSQMQNTVHKYVSFWNILLCCFLKTVSFD